MSFLGVRLGLERVTDHVVPTEDAWMPDTYLPTPGPLPLRQGLLPSVSPKRGCASPTCPSGWSKPWKNRTRPIFENLWACGSSCLEDLVRTAASREVGVGGMSMQETPHRHRLPLGLVMLEQGWIAHPQLRKALEAQKVAGSGMIGEWLQQECGVSPETVTRGLGLQWNCRILPVDGFTPRPMALAMPRLFVEEFGFLPLRIEGARRLYLGFRDHLDASAAFSLEQMSELNIESGILGNAAFAQAQERLLECDFVEATRVITRDTDEMSHRIAEILIERQPIASRLVRLHRFFWLRMWLENGVRRAAGTVPLAAEDVVDVIFTSGMPH